MRAPVPTYEFYLNEHRGKADRDRFLDALPLACARVRELTRGRDVPARCRRAYMHAVCAVADRVSGVDARGALKSETVGSTSVTYADAETGSAFTDADAVRPWLGGTGLLYGGLR